MIRRHAKPSPTGKNLAWAFCTGGVICVLGQWLRSFFFSLGLEEEQTALAVSITLMGGAVLLTAMGSFDKLAKHAGAGTLVPITGFANAMSSCAIEFKTEGFITGMAANMFKVTGPVLTYGISASVVYGLLVWVTGQA